MKLRWIIALYLFYAALESIVAQALQ